MSGGQLGGPAKRPSRLRQDQELASPGATDRDYRLSGFSRDHLSKVAAGVDEVERRSGPDFFSELEDAEECELESGRALLGETESGGAEG